MRRPLPRILAAAVATFVWIPAACGPPEPAPPEARSLAGAAAGYNVVLISVDTLRADRLGAWGHRAHPTSPAMDALVGSGMRFAQASAPRALTWPSLATVLTGLYPSGHGVIYNGYELPDDQPTLPLILGDAGYDTAAFLANMCKANHRGWDTFSCAGGVDRRVNREAIAWLRQRSGESPFLLWVHYFGPHSPYYAGGDAARARLDPGYDGFLAPRKGVLDRVMTEPIPLGDDDLRHLDAIYDAAVMGTDRWIAELWEVLRAEVGLDRTLVVFLSDHGEDLYDHHGYLYHACSVYESSLHVPLAFVAPELIAAGGTHPSPVEIVDVLPTLLDLLGLESPACQHGDTLLPVLEGAALDGGETPLPVYTEYGNSTTFTYRDGDWKLVVNRGGEPPVCMEGVPDGFYPIAERELYDLGADPAEELDLAGAELTRVDQLEAALAEHRRGLCGLREAVPPQLDEQTQRELEALGYVVEDKVVEDAD